MFKYWQGFFTALMMCVIAIEYVWADDSEYSCENVHAILNKILESGIHGTDDEDNTVLHWTAKCGLLLETKEYLSQGADPYARNDFDEIPLHESAGNDHLSVTEELINHEAPFARVNMLNAENKKAETPAHEAAERCQTSSLVLLKKYGADLTKKNTDGETPYDEALKSGCFFHARANLYRFLTHFKIGRSNSF